MHSIAVPNHFLQTGFGALVLQVQGTGTLSEMPTESTDAGPNEFKDLC